ncbi:cobalamin biosynthesis protein [Halotalea alkalilenta]|uniref:cobalamin biosynthesis protein n=1 Tax=Halotalea alkalilenta TaxID=376489 RepID=UPI0005B98606|nr:cobalamin biosynthesis protein [Halotalea alkalilenta]
MTGTRYALGVGFRRHCEIDELVRLVEAGLGAAGLESQAITWLASIDAKRGASQLDALAARFGWNVELWPAERLAATPGVHQHSRLASRLLGSPSVAEAAALASLSERGLESPSLRLATQRSPAATVAIAEACG